MSRSRNIKPSLFKNEVLGTADPLLTILFASLWCIADKEGRLEDRPLRIKAETFPYREGIDINGYLTELERLGFIHRYEAGGLKLIEVINFKKHQHPHHTEKNSEYPCFATACEITVKTPLDTRDAPSDSLNTDSSIGRDTKPPKEKKAAKPQKKQTSSGDDARSSHIAIQGVRELMGRYPDKLLWDDIIKWFGDDIDLDKLKACRIAWIERGYNTNATTWLRWYFDGIPARGSQKDAAAAKNLVTGPTNRELIRIEQERIKAENATIH